jgi:hypothetical protein
VTNFTLVDDLVAFGDLDGDGHEEAAVILFDSPGGSGVFGYLAAIRWVDGAPLNVATAELGDRVQVRSNVITDGTIVLDVLAHDFDDPLCCPTAELVWRYTLDGTKLRRSDKATTHADAPSVLAPGSDRYGLAPTVLALRSGQPPEPAG